MEKTNATGSADRTKDLTAILNHARSEALERVREFRAAQEADVTPPPSDELDVARSLADVETHASLIERAEYQLEAIDAAFNRLSRGRYGACDECGDEIPLARPKILPFAGYCVDCQTRRNHKLRLGEGYIDEPSRHLWRVPEEIDESLDKQDSLTEPGEEIFVRDRQPFGPKVGEFEQLPPVATARRRGRPRKRKETQERNQFSKAVGWRMPVVRPEGQLLPA